MKRVFFIVFFSILHLLSRFLIKSKNFKILGNFMMVGKNISNTCRPWDIHAYWLTLPVSSRLEMILAEQSGSTNIIIVNCTIAIIAPLSAVTMLFLVSEQLCYERKIEKSILLDCSLLGIVSVEQRHLILGV
jgi:hypothetical protein